MRRKRIQVSSGTYWRAPAQFERRMMSQIDLTAASTDCGVARRLSLLTPDFKRPPRLGFQGRFHSNLFAGCSCHPDSHAPVSHGQVFAPCPPSRALIGAPPIFD